MRKNQVSIQIERFGDQVPEGYPEKAQEIMVYADSNDLWEALAAAYSAVMNEIQKHENVRSYNWAEVATNATEKGKLMWEITHGRKLDDMKDKKRVIRLYLIMASISRGVFLPAVFLSSIKGYRISRVAPNVGTGYRGFKSRCPPVNAGIDHAVAVG